MIKFNFAIPVAAISLLCSAMAYADGSVIDKVYDPYVQLLEKEIEFRILSQQDGNLASDGTEIYRIGYGQALNDDFFAEIYTIGQDTSSESYQTLGYELELKWQLSEQGEYDNDWGMLFELEKSHLNDSWEVSTGLITVHEWSKLTVTSNVFLVYEWGDEIKNEWETAFSGQMRYRHSAKLEPAIEVFLAEDTRGLGPAASGLLRIGHNKKINWNTGIIFGLNETTPDLNLKLNLEYEFQ